MIPRSVRAVLFFCLSFVALNVLLILRAYTTLTFFVIMQSWLQYLTPAGGLTVLFLIQEVMLLGLLLLALNFRNNKKKRQDRWQYFVERWKRKGWGLYFRYVVGGLLLYFVCNTFLAFVVYERGVEIPGLFGEQITMTMLEELPLLVWHDYIRIVLLTMIVGPAIEELIYRGFVTDVLMKKYSGVGVILAAGLFAVAHMERGVVVNLFVLSIFLGWIYRKTRSMWYSFLFHMTINGLAIMAMLVVRLYPELVVGFTL